MINQNVLVWFRNDLRIHDNESLYQASQAAPEVDADSGAQIFPIYCFDPRHFAKTSFGFEKTGAFRAKFLIESVANLRKNLRSLNSDLIVHFGNPESIIPELIQEYEISSVYYQAEITSEETTVEKNLQSLLKSQKTSFNKFSGSTLLHFDDLPFEISQLPELFTHFRKQVEPNLNIRKTFPTPDRLNPLPKSLDIGEIPSLEKLGLKEIEPSDRAVLEFKGGETEALKRLDHYFWQSDRLQVYKQTRNGMLKPDDSSKFSPWLALGCLSPRYVYAQANYRTKSCKSREEGVL